MRVAAIALGAALCSLAQNGATPAAPAEDGLGRTSPRSMVLGFLRAAAQDSAVSAQYLEVGGRPGDPESASAREQARKLKTILDRDVSLRLSSLSADPEGDLRDGLPPERERVTSLRTRAGGAAEILLHRVTPAGSPPIWLFSADTLRRLPELDGTGSLSAIERRLPRGLTERTMFGVALWRWLALLVLAPVALGFSWVVARVVTSVASSIASRTRFSLDDAIIRVLHGPLQLFVTVWVFHGGMLALELPALVRRSLGQLELIFAVAAVAWLVLRLVDLAADEARGILIRNHRLSAVSMVPLGRRIVKVLALALAVLVVLDNAGLDLGAVLTGLGVGGIAVALAAQKTLENVFGGVTVVLDQPLRVGDFCKIGDRSGTVEDIGLRSTRLRTPERTVVSVPNGQVAAMAIENFGPREKMWFHPMVALRLDTTAAQADFVLQRGRALLENHPRVEPGGRMRLSGFGSASINLEVHAYVMTANFDEFVIIQEELLLEMMRIIEQAGTSIAMPSQSGYLTRDPQEDADRAREVEGGSGI